MRARPHPRLRVSFGRWLSNYLIDLADMIEARPALAPAAAGALVHPPESGWMPGAIRVLTPHRYHADYKPHLVQPVEMVAIHYTASPPGDGPSGSDLDRISSWARGERRESSTHFVVLRDGRIVQMTPLHDRPWHIQQRFPAPFDGNGSINNRAYAVDLENVGWLKGPRTALRNAYGGRHTGPVGAAPNGSWWEAYPEEQMQSAERVMRFIGQAAPHLRDGRRGRVFRHTEAQPTRPDPGPLCDVDRLRAALHSVG